MASVSAQPVVILTGASKGLGLACLSILLRAGASVVALSRTETPELTALAGRFPGVLVISKGDVSKDADNKAAIDLAMQSFGRLDALILNAGTLDPLGTTASFAGKTEAYKALFDVNFFSLISMVSQALPHLKATEGKSLTGVTAGRVVMVSSGASTGGVAGWGAYSASKAAMNSLARTLGNEEPSIMTVAVRPGVVDTEMQKAIRETGSAHMDPNDLKKFTGLHETGKLVPPHLPGGVLAGLALKGEQTFTGQFLSWDSDDMKAYLLE